MASGTHLNSELLSPPAVSIGMFWGGALHEQREGEQMFYRVTKYNFDEARYDELLAWGESVRAQIEGIVGMRHADMYRSGPGEGMIVAAYDDEASFTAAADTVADVLGGMAQFMTSPPHTHSGTVDVSYGR